MIGRMSFVYAVASGLVGEEERGERRESSNKSLFVVINKPALKKEAMKLSLTRGKEKKRQQKGEEDGVPRCKEEAF